MKITSSTHTAALRTPTKRVMAALGASAALALVTLAEAQPPGPPGHQFNVVTVAEGFRNPWSLAWLPDGAMLVTERGGNLRIVRDGEVSEPIAGVPEVRAFSQGGLHDVLLHPEFESNQLIYLSYAKAGEGQLGTTAISRARLVEDRLEDVEEIFVAEAWNDRAGHFGGRMAFDSEGHLFLTVGDRMEGFVDGGFMPNLEDHPAQDLGSHKGKILRLNDDGSVPDDNPFVGQDGALPEIWSYGHRNPQGLAFHPETGVLFANEHGPQGGDELNVIRPGANYGWPVIGYGVNYTTGEKLHRAREMEGMEQPIAFWVPSIGISGLAFYEGDQFPNWVGNALVGGMSGNYQRIVRVSLNGETVAGREPLLVGEYRVRDVRVGPDGFLYIAVDNQYGQPSNIVRLEPADD